MFFENIKIAFFDVDQTIFNHDTREITDVTIKALNQLKENGVKICIATGRPYEMMASLKEYTDQIPFDYVITSNGQSIYENNQLVYRNFLDIEDLQTIIKIAKEHDLTLSLVGENVNLTTKMNDVITYACDIIGTPLPKVMDIPDNFNQLVDHAVIYESIEYKKYFANVLKHSVMTFWSDYAFEFTPDNGMKVHGIKQVLKHLNLTKDQAIAFGDGDNDKTMLEYVGYGVAMGNASDHVKEHADYVTDHIENDGVAKALEKFKLI